MICLKYAIFKQPNLTNMKRTLYVKQCFALLYLFSLTVFAQDRTVQGTITDDAGVPLPGATVVVLETNQGTTTDFDGNYSIDVSDGQTLAISYVGYTTEEVVVSENSDFSIALLQDSLEEVVVTALGLTREKKSLGYAVTELSGNNINTVKDHNIASSLSGKVAGLNITQSGSIGSASRIVIRGNNSITGNTQALIVVDGIPINADETNSGGSVYNSVVTGGGITDINPADVESISVLKGPNAAALYGSRAGNGVILITTKTGTKSDRIGVSVNTNLTFDDPMFLPEFQNIYGQGTLGAAYTNLESDWGGASWGSKLDGSSQLYFTGENKPYTSQPNNVKNFFRTGLRAINSFSVEKGGDNGSTRFSYTNNTTGSILPNSDLNSHNFNLRGILNLSDKLTVDTKATYFSQEVTNRASLGGEGVMSYVYGLPRNVITQDLEKFQKDNPGSPEEFKVINYAGPNSSTGNPYWILRHDENWEKRNRFFGFTKINYEFTDWLSAFVRIGADITNVKRLSINKPGHHFHPSGRMSKSVNSFGELNSEFLITAKRDLSEKLNIVVSAGGNLSKRTSEETKNFGEDFKIPSKFFFSNTNIQRLEDSPQSIKKVNSLYGSANFAYDNFLYVDLTARNDWSSTLGENNRSYLYNSASISMLLHRFIDPERQLFNLIKLRGSWAEVGNDTGTYQLYQTFNVPGEGYLGLTTLSSPDIRLNPDLRPETVTSNEFGLELSLLNNRLSFDLSIYNMATTDLIFDVPVAAATGFSKFKENLGKVTNRGIEITLGGTPIRNQNLSWNTNLFFSQNKNKLVKLIEGTENLTYLTTNSGNLSLRAQVGGSIGDIYGTVWDKDDSGQYKVNANGIPIASTPDNYLGSALPDWLGGWSNTIIIKNLSFNFLIDARIGGKIYSETSSNLDGTGVSERSLKYREAGITLQAVNTDTNAANTKSITGQEYWSAMSGIAENYIYDQSNIRLREFSIGYRFTDLQKFGVASANVQLIGRNLFFFRRDAEDIDPENSLGTDIGVQGISSRGLPTTRTIGCNITLNF